MTIKFSDGITGNHRGEVQNFIENEVDRDTDVYLSAISENPTNYVYMRVYWHKSPADPEQHLTGDVIFVSFFCVAQLQKTKVLVRITEKLERRIFIEMDKLQCSPRVTTDFDLCQCQCNGLEYCFFFSSDIELLTG